MTKIDIDKFVASLIEFSPQQSMKYIKALADQGLKYKDGKIVSIDSDFTTITIPKDLKGTDTDGGVVGEKGEQGEKPTNKNFKERYENIAKSDWFKKTYKDISIGEEQSTEEEMVGMGELGKAWFEKELLDHIDDVARRLHPLYSLLGHFLTDYNKKTDKIISILQSAILPIPRETYVPPIIKNPLDPDPNTLGGWETTASTEGGGE